MIDIDKLTEAQVRYILNDVIEGMRISVGVETTDYYLQLVGNQLDYPQQTNNEESDND